MRSSTSSREVEGVGQHPRRVVGRVVQRGEVVVVELDLGALGHREAQAQEHVLDLAPGLGDQVQAPGAGRRIAGQRHVDGVAAQPVVQLRGLQRRRALGQQRLQRHLDLVAALAHRAALLGRQVLDRAQHGGQLGLAAQQAHAQLLQLGGRGGAGDGRLALGADLLQACGGVSHCGMTSRRGPGWRPWPRSAIRGRRAAGGFARARRLIQRHRRAGLPARRPPAA